MLDGIPANALEVVRFRGKGKARGRAVQDYRAKLTLDTLGQVNHLVEYLDSFVGL